MQKNREKKKVGDYIFSDISEDRTSGASILAEKALLRIKEIAEEICAERGKISKVDVLHLISYAKKIRPTMVIIKNSVLLLERKILPYGEYIPKKEFISAVEEVLKEIKTQKEAVVQKAGELIRDFWNIAVVSFSSSVKTLLDLYPEKKAFFLEYDHYARGLREKNIYPVSDEELGKVVQAGVMGADAVIISHEGKAKKIINGFPSLKFVEILSSSGKPIFVLAEKLKFTQDDISPSEEGFDEVPIDKRARENIVLVSQYSSLTQV